MRRPLRPICTSLAAASLAALALTACRGEDGGGSRRTFVDSRDTYDPRSLDPALSTDVPTGRAVGYLFDGLTRFTPDARVVPGARRRAGTSRPTASRTPSTCGAGVTFHDGTPVRRRARRGEQLAARARPRDARRPRLAALSHPRRARVRRRQGPTRSPACASPDDTTVVVTLDRAVRDLPEAARDAGRVDRARTHRPPTSASSRSAPGPWKLVEWKHDDYLKFARNDDVLGRRSRRPTR